MVMSNGAGIGASQIRFNGKCSKCGKNIQDYFVTVNRIDMKMMGIVAENWCLGCDYAYGKKTYEDKARLVNK